MGEVIDLALKLLIVSGSLCGLFTFVVMLIIVLSKGDDK